LLTRCQSLRRRFVEHCSWEEATPPLKDPNRVPDPSTLRRWSSGLDRSHPALSFLRQTLARMTHWLARGDPADHQAGPLSWLSPVLQILWPAVLRKLLHPPSLPRNADHFLLCSLPEAKLRRGRGRRKTETAPFAARLSTTAALDRPARR
jgi:hypothetical protein